MAINNFGLNFTAQSTHKVPTRNRPDRYAESPLAARARFEVSEGVRPAEYFAAYKYLPVSQKDITTEDYVVIPKGKIVSAVSAFDMDPDGGLILDTVSGSIASSGVLYGFENQVTGGTGSYGQDTSYFGYDEYISTLLVPATGGLGDADYQYSVEDAGSYKADGSAAADGETCTIPSNKPIGVVYHDWYQDIRGRWLNYRMWPDGGHVLTDWFVEVPFVVDANLIATDSPHAKNTAKQRKLSKVFSYMAIAEGSTKNLIGSLIQPTILGDYMVQTSTSVTDQTVGKLISLDTRFPKSGLEDVETYPGSRMPGTQTAGLPSFLFEFVVATETLTTGTAPTIEEVLFAVRSGKYGVARINISVS